MLQLIIFSTLEPTFSQSVMVLVGVSALGQTKLHFVDPGVNVNIKTYC